MVGNNRAKEGEKKIKNGASARYIMDDENRRPTDGKKKQSIQEEKNATPYGPFLSDSLGNVYFADI